MEYAEFSELCEIVDYLVKKSNDEALLRAYEASYAAINNISFDDFKQRVAQKLAAGGRQPTAEETHKKVKHYIDDYEWEVQRDGD